MLCFTVGWAGLGPRVPWHRLARWKFLTPLLKLVAVLGTKHRMFRLPGETKLVVLSTGERRVQEQLLRKSLGWLGRSSPCPPAGGLGTSPPKPSWQAPSGLWGYEQLSSGHIFSALFSCRYNFPYCFSSFYNCSCEWELHVSSNSHKVSGNRLVGGGVINTLLCTEDSFCFQYKVRHEFLHIFSRNTCFSPLRFGSCVCVHVLHILVLFCQGYLQTCGNWNVQFVPFGIVLEKSEACWHDWQICADLCLDCAVDSTWDVLWVYTEKCIFLENDRTISLYFRVKAVVLSRFPDT